MCNSCLKLPNRVIFPLIFPLKLYSLVFKLLYINTGSVGNYFHDILYLFFTVTLYFSRYQMNKQYEKQNKQRISNSGNKFNKSYKIHNYSL